MTATDERLEAPLTVECLLGQFRRKVEEYKAEAETANARCAAAEAQLLRQTDISELAQQAQGVLSELACWQEVRRLDLARVARECKVRATKTIDLPHAREAYDEVITEITTEAYAEGAVDGKNAEQRKTQLDAYLAANAKVAQARRVLLAVESEVVNAEAELAVAEAESKGALNRWYAARSAADLLAALLNAVGGRAQ